MDWGPFFEEDEVTVIVTFPSNVSAESAQGRTSALIVRSAGISFMSGRLSDCRGPVQ